MSAKPSNHTSPNAIGRFEILKALGRGSQGVVYLAEDPELIRLVAIKTLGRRAGFAPRLLEEARAVSRLKHPNIVPVFELGEHEGNPYVVYEFVDGQSLRNTLRETPRRTVDEAVRWTQQILDAIGAAHAADIVHRDLNPNNIMIDPAGNARVMDFGIAMAVGTQIDPAAGLSGTAHYMAPEQIQGAPVGPRADVFATGLMLYEMLAGRHPVEASDAVAALYTIAHEPFPALATYAPELGGPWEGVVTRALEKDPANRFESALDFRSALVTLLGEGHSDSAGDTASTNSTFGFLLKRMRRRTDFPTMSDQIVEINRKTANSDRTSVNELANTILGDYALTTKLLKLVNSSLYGQYGGRISTVSRAVVILGFKQVRMAAQSLLLFEHLASGPQAAQLSEAAGKAQMGGILARVLAERMHLEEPEEAFLCTMLRDLGRVLTMYYLPEEFADIQRAVSAQGMGEHAACQSVLGLSYETLGVGIAREWQLPITLIESLRELPAGPAEAVGSGPGQLRVIAAFSAGLIAAIADSNDNRSAKIAALQERFAGALPLGKLSLHGLIEDTLTAARAYGPIINERLESTGAFRDAEKWLAKTVSKSAESPEIADPHQGLVGASEAGDVASAIIINGIQDITNALIENCTLNDILVMILETLYRGLSFTRVVLCIQDKRRGEMVARFGLGRGLEELKPRFRFPLSAGDDAFSLAVHQHRDFAYPSRTTNTAELPAWFRNLLTPDLAVGLPLVVKGVCFGLIYCDREGDRTPLTATDINYLHTLRNQAALAIKQSS